MSKNPKIICITTGDTDGIGTEVASKALQKLKPQKNTQFLFWRSRHTHPSHLLRLKKVFELKTVESWPEALNTINGDAKTIVDIKSSRSPANWFEEAIQAAKCGYIDGIVTGPLSKTEIQKAGLSDRGHTDILRRQNPNSKISMCFVGSLFSTVLVTDHLAVSELSTQITPSQLKAAIASANELRSYLTKKDQRKSIGVLGLDPHAGEGGIIGSHDREITASVIDRLKKDIANLEGPLVPDVAYQTDHLKRYSVMVAQYHDQGLIPFKSLHKSHSGVQMTLGLPFVRTSVDHGTAKDIFGGDSADFSSMYEAIRWAIKLSKVTR